MLNASLSFQTLVAIVALAAPALADPPGALAHRVQSFSDWRIDCRADPCELATSVNGADGREVLRLAVGREAVAVTTLLPLFLPDGVAFAIGADPALVPWRTCDAAGCEATLPLDPLLLDALKRERAGNATVTLVDGVKVRLPFSLLGFSAALGAFENRATAMGPLTPRERPSIRAPPGPRPAPRGGPPDPAR